MADETKARIESELEVKAYIQNLKFALSNGAKIDFQAKRRAKRSEMREFGKVYSGKGDVYIKIRVELLGIYGNTTTFVMSFHFAEKAFTSEMFPYRKN